jgi:AraC-like DNA-binding protein
MVISKSVSVMSSTVWMPHGSVLHERDTMSDCEPCAPNGILERMVDDFWRSRAGVPRSRGVLAGRAGMPAVVPGAPGTTPSEESPVRLVRLPPSDRLAALVRHYWIPRWQLPAGRTVTQRVLEYPSANLVVEGEAVALHGPSVGLGTRTLTGDGAAFGALVQPGVAGALLDVDARSLVGRSIPLASASRFTAADAATGLITMHEAVRRAVEAGDDLGAVAAFESWFARLDLRLPRDAQLVRELVARAEEDRSLVRVEQLAALAGVGVRQLERIVREQLGLTPKWLIRRYRLQEAADRLTPVGRPALADLATELGYVDQAHFTREFAAVVGVPPGRYVREAGS